MDVNFYEKDLNVPEIKKLFEYSVIINRGGIFLVFNFFISSFLYFRLLHKHFSMKVTN